MKFTPLIVALTIAASGQAFAAGAHEHQPAHGGTVVEVRDVDYELVTKPGKLQLYLRDHDKPVDVSQAKARLTLLTGTQKQAVELSPVGGRLEAVGSFKVGAGTKIIAVVTTPGKSPATVRFVLK